MSDYYARNIDLALREWRDEPHRKVLMLRGARQVGKSSAVLPPRLTWLVLV